MCVCARGSVHTCIDVSVQSLKKKRKSSVSLFRRLLFVCESEHRAAHVGKGGIQGLCKWVCIQYMCVIMGMRWYKCGVCITCMSVCVRVCAWECVCVWPSYATHYITNLCKPPQEEKQSETLRLRPQRHQRGRGTCDRACQPASLPDKLYSHKLLSLRPYFTLGLLCAMTCTRISMLSSNHSNASLTSLTFCFVVNPHSCSNH